MHYDVAVVGLGAMGSATVYQLAKAGATVLGIDRYAPPHALGSTHGDTRITRLAIGEGAEYVPLVKRSHEIWRDIERQVGTELLRSCGGLVMAGRDAQGMHGSSEFLGQTVASARRYGIEHELLSTAEIESRFPQLNVSRSETAYYEPEAGILRPEACVAAQLNLAAGLGATLRTGEQVSSFTDDGRAVSLVVDGETVTADRAVIAVGPWIRGLVQALASRIGVYRQTMYWFDLADRSEYEAYARLPIYIWEYGGGGRDDFIYGFPMVDGPAGGAKVAREDYTSTTSPDDVQREVTQDEVDLMYESYVRERLPGLSRTCVKAVSCLYTVTPDRRFVIDCLPAAPNVIVASPCSGHGFKHSAAIGECLSQLVLTGRTDIDISTFALPAADGEPGRW